MADTDPCISKNHCSNVRVIAKIRDFTYEESQSLNGGGSIPWICVYKPHEVGFSDKFTISIGDQPASRKDSYEVDHCYQQNEDIDLIFSREIQPLILEVFEGQKASVIAYGARGSGKTYTIQGSEEKHGLATLAFAEILRMAEEKGNSVTISLYDVFQDHVYDLLDSKHTEIQVLEDAHGKIKLKGLSRVTVKSVSEFHKLYYTASKLKQQRSHKGLMIHLLSCDQNSNTKLVGKMNFVDLAGYESSRRNNIDGSSNLVDITRTNKSLYALQNVVYALAAKEHRVPYRESKLTRVLQDSLGETNRVLMLTCLNPSFCQDTIHALSLASRPCRSVIQVSNVFPKKSKSSAKSAMDSSSRNRKPLTVSGSTKKQANPLFQNKGRPMVKGRKLFEDGNQLVSCNRQELSQLDAASSNQPNAAFVIEQPSLSEEVMSLPSVTKETEFTTTIQKDVSPHSESSCIEDTPSMNGNTKALTLIPLKEDEKENKNLMTVGDESPPLSVRLKEISNNLKSLCSSPFPLCIKAPPQSEDIISSSDVVEPRTPVVLQDSRVNDKWEPARITTSPWETFSARSSGMKHKFAQDCVQFLNSASKEELKGFKGIGEKRATYILELREESPEPFKTLDDLREIGLSAKQIKGMMKKVAGDLFS